MCPACRHRPQADPVNDVQELNEISLDEKVNFEMVDQFCYLGDMIGAGGGVTAASRTRVRCGWKMFHELAPVLTLKGASFKLKGEIYKTCVRSGMTYGSETWPIKVEDINRLIRAERMMRRRMCGVTLRGRVNTDTLYDRHRVDRITGVVTRGRLRWFGHVKRKPDSDWTRKAAHSLN